MAVIPTALLARQGAKQASKISAQHLGFDFIPLITSLLIFYSIAFVFAKYMEGVQFATGGIRAIAGVLGYNMPSTEELPNTWTQLFSETGVKGFKFWDIINIVAILIIIATAFNFQKTTEATGNKVQPITWAIFTMLVSFIVITGVSKLVMKLQQRNFQSEFK